MVARPEALPWEEFDNPRVLCFEQLVPVAVSNTDSGSVEVYASTIVAQQPLQTVREFGVNWRVDSNVEV